MDTIFFLRLCGFSTCAKIICTFNSSDLFLQLGRHDVRDQSDRQVKFHQHKLNSKGQTTAILSCAVLQTIQVFSANLDSQLLAAFDSFLHQN